MSVGENIKRLRLERGMTQEQLADAIGKTRTAVTQYESGWTSPRMGVVEELARVFGVPKSAIVDDCNTSYAQVRLDPDRDELLALWDKMDARGREAVLAVARTLSPDGAGRAVPEGRVA